MGSYCTNCGTRVKATDRYCPVCGNSLDDYGREIPQEQSGYSDENSYNEPEDVKERTNTGRVIAIIGALFVIAASFLPYVSYDVLGLGEAITLMEHGDGIIFLIAAIFALLLFCVKSKVLALLSAIVVGVMAWYEYQSTMEILNGMGILAGVVDKEFGFYALIIGAAFLVIGAVINLMDN